MVVIGSGRIRVAVIVKEIPTIHVVDVSVSIVINLGVRVLIHVNEDVQVGVTSLHAIVDYGNYNRIAAGSGIPCFFETGVCKVAVCVGFGSCLAPVLQVPLLRLVERIVWLKCLLILSDEVRGRPIDFRARVEPRAYAKRC